MLELTDTLRRRSVVLCRLPICALAFLQLELNRYAQ